MSSDPLELKATFQAEYRARWEAVETARAQELASMTEDRARQIIQSLRPFAPLPPNPSDGMGLVEQQLGLLEASIELRRDLRGPQSQPLPIQGHRLAPQLPSQRGGRGQPQHQRQPRRGIAKAEKLVHCKCQRPTSTETDRGKSKRFRAAG